MTKLFIRLRNGSKAIYPNGLSFVSGVFTRFTTFNDIKAIISATKVYNPSSRIAWDFVISAMMIALNESRKLPAMAIFNPLFS